MDWALASDRNKPAASAAAKNNFLRISVFKLLIRGRQKPFFTFRATFTGKFWYSYRKKQPEISSFLCAAPGSKSIPFLLCCEVCRVLTKLNGSLVFQRTRFLFLKYK